MPRENTERIELLKRQAAGIAAQLPTSIDDALTVLQFTDQIIRNLGNIWASSSHAGEVVPMRLVKSDSPE